MPALSNEGLFAKLRAALPAGSRFETPAATIHPAVADIPGFGRTRCYLWTVTPDRSTPGARPPGEFKIQLIIEGQERGARGSLDTQGAYTVLLGYSPDYGVFVGWEAGLYRNFAYSANVQVREELLASARETGWAVAPPRRSQDDVEVRVAFSPGNLGHFIKFSRQADSQGARGVWREAVFLANTPTLEVEPLPEQAGDLVRYTERQRARFASTRFARDTRFAPLVKEQFDYACALCAVQLEIVEAAHIVPVFQAGSSDDIWNGLALCPNHHTLFDAVSFVVRPDLIVHVDPETVAFLTESRRANGLELLTRFDGVRIRVPHFWEVDATVRRSMQAVLEQRAVLVTAA